MGRQSKQKTKLIQEANRKLLVKEYHVEGHEERKDGCKSEFVPIEELEAVVRNWKTAYGKCMPTSEVREQINDMLDGWEMEEWS